MEKNLRFVAKVEELAREKRCTSAELALAWVLAQGNDVVPIPGTKRRKFLEENLAAVNVKLTKQDLDWIESEIPRAQGERYDHAGMSAVNR